jgi:hypothetical protein
MAYYATLPLNIYPALKKFADMIIEMVLTIGEENGETRSRDPRAEAAKLIRHGHVKFDACRQDP